MSLPDPDEPIAAPASAPGGAERAIIRLSGPGTPRLLRNLFTPAEPDADPGRGARRFEGELRLDAFPAPVPAAALVWPTERSYTGQPSAELHLPGSPPVVEATLSALHAVGFRPAGPGEFTLRAFLAGRIGLTEAEAVLGVVDAADPDELHTALNQLAGGVSNRLAPVRSDLLDLLADLEAGLDFAEEDVSFVEPDVLRERIEAGRGAIAALAEDAAGRSVSHTAPRVVLAGPPNAGKSSLLNALSGRPAALVSPTAGTTRDDVSETVRLGEATVELIDTAGEETAADELSAAAQARRAETLAAADLVLHCVPPGGAGPAGAGLVVHTKADLRAREEPGELSVSAATGAGLAELRMALAAALERAEPRRHLTGATAARGGAALREAATALERAGDVVELGDELVAAELRTAIDALGEVLGVVYHDDLLGRIFGRFCIGK
ncbi:tRNA modification GTPase [Alienimonas californiensis]|uniref:tRNA modification GTPase MnmE n=1 Tax=Alienimonas californiensis TaxID=2527989 RepID=A0A517P5N0_9PLAN|nr:GTPase [Alienimonas californiensis]QDT14688.1 tRNA modification GTPase MnmE [Alienimonas californiensis]